MKTALLAGAATIAGLLLFLLASASANTSLFARNYPLLLAANGVLVVSLGGMVLYQLRKLWREHQSSLFGSRLKLRLVAMFGGMSRSTDQFPSPVKLAPVISAICAIV